MKTIGDALSAMLPAFTPVGVERVQLHQAQGRFLAEPEPARFDLPPFDNSAMDGYAVRAADLAAAGPETPVSLSVRGESRAGGPTPGSLPAGAAMRIFTGAPMPPGADAIVPQEQTRPGASRDGGDPMVAVHAEPPPVGAHLRARGSDLRTGEPMVPEGVALGPGEIGLIASQGIAAVSVHRRPLVAIVSTGDELRDVTDPPRPGSIVNSNAYALAAQVRDAGGEPWILPNVPDEMEATLATLREALRADVVLTCGGVSVGDYDLTKDAFAQLGIDADFWKVRIKPGKPLTFGRAGDGTPVVGLPGNPVSAMVTFDVFVRPGLRRMLGDPKPFPAPLRVVLAVDHRHGTGRTELARAFLEPPAAPGELPRARPHRLQGSGSLPSVVGVDAYLILDGEQRDFPAGSELDALPIRGPRGSASAVFD
jgi:molybdopterin molybdotransferase